MSMFIMIAVFVLILGGGALLAVRVGEQQSKRERYAAVIARNKTFGGEDSKEKQLARQRADIARKLKEAGASEKKKDKVSIHELMQQAGIDAPVSKYYLWSFVFAASVCGILFLVSKWHVVTISLITVTALFGIPKLFLKWRAGRRQKAILEEFADALDASVRLLQAGMPITEAIAMASREFTGPLKEEMTRIYDNQKVGVPLGQAALETAKRMPLTEVHMFATALQIQSETGSSLSEVLSNLSAVIRARFRLKRKVKALSSEAKASAAIIAALPVLVTLGLYGVNPDYISVLYTTPKGKVLAFGAVIWMSLGVFIMKQMINFKV